MIVLHICISHKGKKNKSKFKRHCQDICIFLFGRTVHYTCCRSKNYQHFLANRNCSQTFKCDHDSYRKTPTFRSVFVGLDVILFTPVEKPLRGSISEKICLSQSLHMTSYNFHSEQISVQFFLRFF